MQPTMNQAHADPSAQPERAATPRIVVAVDTSRQSLAALEEAAALAALMHAELESLFVEDINLLHLCGFPFCNQIGSYTATVRRVDNQGMERELRALATRLREETERIARRVQVPWRFQVRRGPVVSELLDAAQSALFLSLGRTGVNRRRALGSTAQAVLAQSTRPVLILGETRHTQPPLVVVYTNDEAGQRALDLALRLAPRYGHQLQVWLGPAGNQDAQDGNATDAGNVEAALRSRLEAASKAYTEAHEEALAFEIAPLASRAALLSRLQSVDHTSRRQTAHKTVILPNTQADLIPHHDGPIVLVP